MRRYGQRRDFNALFAQGIDFPHRCRSADAALLGFAVVDLPSFLGKGSAHVFSGLDDVVDQLGEHLRAQIRILLRRLGRSDEALAAYGAAIALAGTEPERAFLQRRRDELRTAGTSERA